MSSESLSSESYIDENGYRRWDLPGGLYVLEDSAIDGGGYCIRRATDHRVVVMGRKEMIAAIGADHPAIAAIDGRTECVREAHKVYGRELQEQQRDWQRFIRGVK